MAAITTRQTAGTGATVAGVPLTNAQLDTNFINLNDAVVDAAANTTVTAAAYTNTNLTVDARGRITAAANGSPGGVTSVTGTAPIVSSGGTTPAISIPVATTSVNGYLSSTDWATFNGKAPIISPTFTGTIGIATTPVLNSNEGEITSGRLLGRYSYRIASGTPYYMDYNNGTTINSGDSTTAVRLSNLVTTNATDSNIGVAYGTSYGNKKAGMFFVSGTAPDVLKVATGQIPLHAASINGVGIGYPTNGPRILFQDFAAEDDEPNVISYVGTAHRFVGSTTSKQALLPNTTIISSQAGFNVNDSFIGATSNYSFYGNMPIGVVGGTNASTISSISQNDTTITIVTTAAHNLVTGQIVTIAATANATTLISGVPATILTVGTTDFTLIGSTSNLIGTTFITTGSGTGSGTVTLATQNSGKAVTIIDSVTFTYIHGTSTIPTLTSTHSAITPLTGTVTPSTRYNLYMAGTADNYIASNLGIGTTSPGSKLTVAGQIESTTTGFKFPDGTTQATAASGGGLTLSDDTATNASYYPIIATATSGSQSTAKVTSTKLYFNPSTGTLSATIHASLSDITKKTNVKNISGASNIIDKLQGVGFDWKDGSGSSYGFIAQDLEKVVPNVVTTDIEGIKSVNYSAIIPFLLETIKEQNIRISKLEALVRP